MKLQTSIEHKLKEALDPIHLEVVNESHKHSVPAGSETHFKVVAVSHRFEGMRLLDRHRAINSALSEEMNSGLHALALHCLTPEEWFAKGGIAPESPPCLGGSKTEA